MCRHPSLLEMPRPAVALHRGACARSERGLAAVASSGSGEPRKASSVSRHTHHGGVDRLASDTSRVGVYSLAMKDRTILEQLRGRLVSFAASRVQRDVAEDLTQETLLLLTTKYREVTSLADLVPLSIKIIRFKILSHRRKTQRRGENTNVPMEDIDLRDERASPHTLAEQRQAVERLKAALARLGGRCRELFRLMLEGKSFAEIGALLGARSVNTVYTWEFRCRGRLRRMLGASWVPEVAS